MANDYFCPHCRSSLNPGAHVVMRISHRRQRGLILLSPQVGNYRRVLPEGFDLESGELVDFSCPVCGGDLTSPVDRKLGEVLLRRGVDEYARVNFSKVFGERATFVVETSGVHPYGAHAARYDDLNFFGEGRSKSP
ncbi:MAG: hypothetical protein JXR83_14410 [Deltaproteobacteria bacterium]|nr:hypothetical protein [Deltaproteobacteria bacterium]